MGSIGSGQVAIHSGPVEGDDDDFAAMAVVSVFFLLGDVDDGEGQSSNVAVFDQNPGALKLVPVVDRAIGVADEAGTGFIGKALILPAGYTVAGDKVISAAVSPIVDEDVVPTAAEPEDWILEFIEVILREAGEPAVDAIALNVVGTKHVVFADENLPGALDNLEAAVWAEDEADVRSVPGFRVGCVQGLHICRGMHRVKLVLVDGDRAEELEGAIYRAGGEDVAVARLTNNDGVAGVGQLEGGNVVALPGLIIGPEKALVAVGTKSGVANGLDCLGVKPSAVSLGLIPAAREHVVFAVRATEDLAVPVVPLLHGDVFKPVPGVAGSYGGRAPNISGELAGDRDGTEVVYEGLGAKARRRAGLSARG